MCVFVRKKTNLTRIADEQEVCGPRHHHPLRGVQRDHALRARENDPQAQRAAHCWQPHGPRARQRYTALGAEGGACRVPREPRGRCLHFECRGAPARVRAWRCEGRPPLPHHFVQCGDVYLTLPWTRVGTRLGKSLPPAAADPCSSTVGAGRITVETESE